MAVVMDFVERGGSSLTAYPDYHRIKLVGDKYRVVDRKIAAFHRMSIGTIVGDASVQVKYLRGNSIGTVEESFVGRLSPGDRFTLGGKLLQLVRVHDNTAWVKRGKGQATALPRWMGGRMPLSSELAQALRDQLTESLAGKHRGPAMRESNHCSIFRKNGQYYRPTMNYLSNVGRTAKVITRLFTRSKVA